MLRSASAESLDVDARCQAELSEPAVAQIARTAESCNAAEHSAHPANSDADSGLELDGRVATVTQAPRGAKRRRREAPSPSGDSQSGALLPAPSTLPGLMNWAAQYVSELHSANLSSTLVTNLAKGVNLFSDYSGVGSLEQVARHIHRAVQHIGLEPGRGFVSIRACDIAKLPQKVLLHHDEGPEKPKHIFKDLTERVPTAIMEDLHRIREKYLAERAETLQQATKKHPERVKERLDRIGKQLVRALQRRLQDHPLRPEDRSSCVRHGKLCPMDGYPKEKFTGGVDLWAAGSTCTDHSSAGKCLGVFGPTIVPNMVWCWAVACSLPDVGARMYTHLPDLDPSCFGAMPTRSCTGCGVPLMLAFLLAASGRTASR